MCMAALLTFICIRSFTLLPHKIFLDFDESERLFVKPYFDIKANKNKGCTLLLFFFFLSACFFLFNSSPLFNLRFIIVCMLLGHILISDFLFQIIPDEHIYILALICIIDFNLKHLLGALFGFLPFFTIFILSFILFGGALLGFGDVKLMAVLGLLVGPFSIIQIYIISCAISGVFCVGLLAKHYIKKFALNLKNSLSGNEKANDYEACASFIPLAPFIVISFSFSNIEFLSYIIDYA